MTQTLPSFMHPIEDAIAAVETRSAAELVVAVTRWSGSYRDVDFVAGTVSATVGLLIILFAPFDVDPAWVTPEVLLFGVIGVLLSRRQPAVRRLLSGSARRRSQVQAEASRAFHEERVSATRDRSGVLLLVSLGEEQARIVPDLEVAKRVPAAEWQRLESELTAALSTREWISRFAGTIRASGELLAKAFPVRDDDVDELPNAVRIRP